MPELPEVETVCQELRALILNKSITDAKLLNNHKLRQKIPNELETETLTAKVIKIERRAKYILIFLSNNKIIVLHLGMSGKLLIKEATYSPLKHDHVFFTLDHKVKMVYNDPRRFGLIDLIEHEQLQSYPLFLQLGIEPLSDEFTLSYFIKLLEDKKTPIKLFLMNNKHIVGVGNIYAAESLFQSKISPTRIAATIKSEEAKLLHHNIIKILKESIKFGGSTLKDYAKVSGESGYFQNNFNVYGREGKLCLSCDGLIIKITQGSRSTFYCHNCQK